MSKINKLKQVDGKVQTKRAPRTLDEVFGYDGTSKYKTMDETVYENELAELNRSDLHSHACKIGLIPHASREILVGRLKREFKKHVAAYSPTEDLGFVQNNVKPSKEALDIMAETKS